MFKRIFVLVLGLCSSAVFAEETVMRIPTQNTLQNSVKSDLMAQALEVAGTLALIVGFILVCAWVFKFLQRSNFLKNSNIKLIGTFSISSKEKLLLVNVEGIRILLGVSPGNISGLHVFPEGIKDESIAEPQMAKANSSFLNTMQEAFKKNEK